MVRRISKYLNRESKNILKLFAGLLFLRLKGRDVFSYQFLYPSIVAVLIFCVVWFNSESKISFHVDFFEKLAQIAGILLGFYMAALAAVASFGQELLDQTMKGNPPRVIRRLGAIKVEEALTRREFLCALFGYTAFLSIVIVIACVSIQALDESVIDLSSGEDGVISFEKIYLTVMFFLFWICSSLGIVSLLGIYYLVDRMHRE